MTTQHELIGSDLLGQELPILRETSLQIADPQVRYVGTLGGNVANGDPGNDMPAVMMCLERDLSGRRQGRRAAHPGARVLPGRLFHRAGAGRDPHRDPHSGAAGGPRLRLREAQAQDRRLRDRRRRRGADHERRGTVATCSIGLTNVAETPLWAEEAAQDPRRLDARCRDREEGRRRRRGDHLAGLRPARPAALPHQDGGRDARARARARRRSAPGESDMAKIPGLDDGERQDGRGAGRAAHAC